MRHELDFTGGEKDDLELTLLALDEGRAGDLDLLAVRACVSDFEWAAAADLEAIVVDRSRGDAIDAKAGAGVIDFKKLNIGAGAVLDGGVDVVRVARCGGEEDGGEKSGEECAAHRAGAGHLSDSS